MRLRAKNDANHRAIVAALKQCGWRCWNVKWPADLAIWRPGSDMIWVEIKRPDQKIRLTKSQQDLKDSGAPFVVLQSVFDVSTLSARSL